MRPRSIPQRLHALLAVIGLAVLALTLTATLPHHHEHAQADHSAACRVCRLEQHTTATPVAVAAAPAPYLCLTGRVLDLVALALPARTTAPAPARAPPILL